MLGGHLVDQGPAKPLELGVGQPDGAADASLAQRGQPGRVGGVASDALFRAARRRLRLRAAGRTARPGTARRSSRAGARPTCRSRSRRPPAAAPRASSRTRWTPLRSGRRRRRGWPPCASPCRLQGELVAQVADHADRQLVLVLGPGRLDEVGMRARLDLHAAGAGLARVELGVGASLAQRALRQLAREGALADPLGPDEQKACGNRPCRRLVRSDSTTRSWPRTECQDTLNLAFDSVEDGIGVGRRIDQDDRRRVVGTRCGRIRVRRPVAPCCRAPR